MQSKEKEEDFDKMIHYCDICGNPMIERNCEIICINCGYTRDCSDP